MRHDAAGIFFNVAHMRTQTIACLMLIS